MSVTYIPDQVKLRLWVLSAGRCQYDGCNEPLWKDSVTQAKLNKSYIAHIVADVPGGPRGDLVLSEQLKNKFTNLMLLCDVHHRLIDREDVVGHPVERLSEMKRKHEKRIELLTSIAVNMNSHILLYGANVGQHGTHISWDSANTAMIPTWYPANNPAIELNLKNSSFYDNEQEYWKLEREQLCRQFSNKVKPGFMSGDIKHLSVFGLAPQPLLIQLGVLISDIHATEVYQLHREPSNWNWQDDPSEFEYVINKPQEIHANIALNISLSANIDNERIYSILGENTSIWTITILKPDNDFLKSRQQLKILRELYRNLFNSIKTVHGHDNSLNVFSAAPVAASIELGRVWMPKADLPMNLFDENRQVGGFKFAFRIE
jgi:hypothetical protein